MFNVACGNGFPLGIPTGDGGGGGASTAADVSYDNTSSGLTADDVQAAIDELAGDISAPEKTETLTPTENETYAEILLRLYALIDVTKLTVNSKIITGNGNIYQITRLNAATPLLEYVSNTSSNTIQMSIQLAVISSTPYAYLYWLNRQNDGTLTKVDKTNDACSWTNVYLQY